MRAIIPFLTEQQRLLEELRQSGITDRRVLEAMAKVPREFFVPAEMRLQAYRNIALPIGDGQTISQPYMVGLMTQALELRPFDRVLEIGTGSGYQTAILAELASEVTSIERLPLLALQAKRRLELLSYSHAYIFAGDGTIGLPERGPYDAIIVTAGGPQIPPSLLDQLATGGRLVAPVGSSEYQTLQRVIRCEDSYRMCDLGGCCFVPLIGSEGWAEL
jgi:protein-L-isoaspartate(D-aspartate) O-methyltransferase